MEDAQIVLERHERKLNELDAQPLAKTVDSMYTIIDMN